MKRIRTKSVLASIYQTVIRPIINVIVGGGGSGSGFIASVVKAAVQLTNRFTLLASENKPAIAVEATRHALRTPQMPAVSAQLLGASGSALSSVSPAASVVASLRDVARFLQRPAVAVVQSLRAFTGTVQIPAGAFSALGATGSARRDVTPAVECGAVLRDFTVQSLPASNVVQVTYGLSRRVGGNAVVETAVAGRTDWANDANATGMHNAVNATFAGNALGARAGQLELSYADSVSKSDLTITAASLHFYGSVAGTLANNADVQLKYDIGAGFVLLQTITGNLDFLTTPLTFDITAQLNTWAEYDALRTAFSANAAIAETWTANLDAVEVEITATRTDTL